MAALIVVGSIIAASWAAIVILGFVISHKNAEVFRWRMRYNRSEATRFAAGRAMNEMGSDVKKAASGTDAISQQITDLAAALMLHDDDDPAPADQPVEEPYRQYHPIAGRHARVEVSHEGSYVA